MKNFRLQISFLLALAFGLALRAQTTPLSGGTGVATDATITFTDITTNNSSVSKHGFLPKLSGNAGDAFRGDGTFGAVGTGTVTHTLGALTLNALVLGNAAADTQTVAGFTTDGVSILTLGVAGASVGTVAFKNATSGTASLLPPTGALGTFNVTLPNAASTLPIYGAQMTYAGPSAPRTITYPDASFTVARTDAANTFTGVQSMTSPAITTSITSPSTTFALLNVTPTTINAFGAATTINMGNSAGTTNLLGSLALNPGGSVAGVLQLGQGTLPALGTTAVAFSAPAAVTSYNLVTPGSVGSTGLLQWSVSGTTATLSSVTTVPTLALGSSTATTQAAGDNSTKVATTQYTDRAALTVPNAQTGTTYTLVAADGVASTAGVTMNNASANTLTIPANASVAFAIGTMIPVTQLGAGVTTIAITSDTLNSNGTLLTIPGQYCTVVLHKIGATTWNAYGTGPVVTYPTTTAINTLLYSSAANVISATAATVNNAVITTSSGGVPGPSTTLPSGLTIPAPVFSTGATASGSGNFDLSGCSGNYKSPTGTNQQAKITTYNTVATAGWGVPAIYAAGRSTAQTAANASVSTYTCGAADGSFEVSANILVTTSTTHAFTCTCAYTDEGNTARTITFTFSNVGGTLLTSIANTGGAVPYEGIPLHIRVKASTAITIATTGTFTSVTYNVEGIIRQLL